MWGERFFRRATAGFGLLVAPLIVHPAMADQSWPALGWHCVNAPQTLTLFEVRFDADDLSQTGGDGLYVPQANGWDDIQDEIRVAECNVGTGRQATVVRTFLNSPRPSGLCGGAAWSRYDVRIEGELVADFVMGCSGEPFFQANENGVRLCDLGALGEPPCLRRADGVLVFDLSGNLHERAH